MGWVQIDSKRAKESEVRQTEISVMRNFEATSLNRRDTKRLFSIPSFPYLESSRKQEKILVNSSTGIVLMFAVGDMVEDTLIGRGMAEGKTAEGDYSF